MGLDLPPRPLPGCPVPLVQADALFPPFRPASFETIFCFDVIEHVAEDKRLLATLVELLSPGGTLWLSTPCADFRLFPAFLMPRFNRGVGHLRNGYTVEELEGMLPPGCQATFTYWNEPFQRAFYLLLHFLSFTWPWLALRGAAFCAWLDHFPLKANAVTSSSASFAGRKGVRPAYWGGASWAGKKRAPNQVPSTPWGNTRKRAYRPPQEKPLRTRNSAATTVVSRP